jgi:hypothetical protein
LAKSSTSWRSMLWTHDIYFCDFDQFPTQKWRFFFKFNATYYSFFSKTLEQTMLIFFDERDLKIVVLTKRLSKPCVFSKKEVFKNSNIVPLKVEAKRTGSRCPSCARNPLPVPTTEFNWAQLFEGQPGTTTGLKGHFFYFCSKEECSKVLKLYYCNLLSDKLL